MNSDPQLFPLSHGMPEAASSMSATGVMNSPRDPAFATTLAHGLAVLQSFRTTKPALINKELVAITGLSKGTISRLTHTLMEKGLLFQENQGRYYRLAPGILAMAYPVLANLWIRQVARPYMQELAKQTGSTVSIGVFDQSHMVYVETVRGHDLQSFRPEIGACIPIESTAMGRAWYAQATANEKKRVLTTLMNQALSADQAVHAKLEQAYADLMRKGFCTSSGEWHPDVHAIASPLPVDIDGDRLVLNCGIKASLLGQKSVEDLCGAKLLTMIKKVQAAVAKARHEQDNNAIPSTNSRNRHVLFANEYILRDRQADSQFARTLANGIDVLLCFLPGENALGNKAFSERTGLSPSTIARLTYTLEKLGYLRRTSGKTQYRLGLSLLTTAYPLLAGTQLRQLARPLMHELAKQVNGAVSLVVQDRCRLIFVETSRFNESLPTRPDIGSSMPLLNTAAGKAWLCQAPPAMREQTLNTLRVRDPQEYETYFPSLAAASHEFKQTGCCSNQSQWHKDVYGFAVTLGQSDAAMVYVFNCGVPAKDGPFEDRRQEIIPLLRTLVRRIETFLGH